MASYPTRKPFRRNFTRADQGRQESARWQPKAPAPVAPPPTEKQKPIVEGNPKLWVTLQRVTDPSSGWVKTTRAMKAPGGVLINTCSRKQGSAIVAEALCLIPGADLYQDDASKQWRLT